MKSKVSAIRKIRPLAMLMVGYMATAAAATPMTWGDGVQPLRWPDGKTINIYIESDPDPGAPDISALLKVGMDRWVSEMASRNITINVTVGAVPNPAPANLVRCKYKAVGSSMDLDAGFDDAPTLGGQNKCLTGCAGVSHISTGEMIVRSDLWDAVVGNNMPEREEGVRNLGAHEMTHLLGLADDTKGSVTDHAQTNNATTFSDYDRAEISKLYPVVGDSESKADGETSQSSNPDKYDMNFSYVGPADGHVTLITMAVHPAVITDVIAPSGWVVLDPSDPGTQDRSHPYYATHLIDGHPVPPPWAPGVQRPLAFRAEDSAAALTVSNPTAVFSIIAHNHVPGPVTVWAGGSSLQTLTGPVLAQPIPATSFWPLLAMGTLLAIALTLAVARRVRVNVKSELGATR